MHEWRWRPLQSHRDGSLEHLLAIDDVQLLQLLCLAPMRHSGATLSAAAAALSDNSSTRPLHLIEKQWVLLNSLFPEPHRLLASARASQNMLT